jgi:hypothetical protein
MRHYRIAPRSGLVYGIALAAVVAAPIASCRSTSDGSALPPPQLRVAAAYPLRHFEPTEVQSYLDTLARMNPSLGGDLATADNDVSPVDRDQGLYRTLWRWDANAGGYKGVREALDRGGMVRAWVDHTTPEQRCSWRVDGQPRNAGCREGLHDLREGQEVGVVVEGTGSELVRVVKPVRRQVLIVLGDSYASGEGVPDIYVSWSRRSGPRWWDRFCHRSLFSGPALAGAMLADDDPMRSVLVLSFACSGARIRHLLSRPYENAPSERYKGQEPARVANDMRRFYGWYNDEEAIDPADSLEPQVLAAANTLCQRTANPKSRNKTCLNKQIYPEEVYVAISVGGNDFGFVDFMSGLLTRSTSKETREKQLLNAKREIHNVSAAYAALANDITNLLHPDAVFVLPYPNPTKGEIYRQAGSYTYCDDTKNVFLKTFFGRSYGRFLFSPLAPISDQEMKFASEEFLPVINDTIKAAISNEPEKAWIYLHGLQNASSKHGYCSSQTYFRTHYQAAQAQERFYAITKETLIGTFSAFVSHGIAHPNLQGQRMIGCFLAASIRSFELGKAWPDRPVPWPRACTSWDEALAEGE